MGGGSRVFRAYGALLRLFPSDFRREYGRDMERLFRERWSETRGRAARVALGAAALWDVVRHALLEWGAEVAKARTSSREGRMNGWWQDLRLALRALVRRPGFTAAVVGTLALGIGVVVSLFSVVDAVLLRPLPYPESERLVVFEKVDTEDGSRARSTDHPDIDAWAEAVPGMEVLGHTSWFPTLLMGRGAEVVTVSRVTGAPLATFGVRPRLGRDLVRADDAPEGPRVVLLSHGFWTERMGGAPDVLGRALTIDGEPWEIVGVAPEGFRFPGDPLLWMPRMHDREGCDHGCNIMVATGRLPAGMDVEAARERLRATDARLGEAFPEAHGEVVTDLRPLHEYEVADVRGALWILMGAVVLVLLIACANVANLMIVRGAARTGEVAVRATLGASRGRIVRQLLVEALVLAALAGALGTALASWGTEVLVAMAPDTLPRMEEVGLDARAVVLAGLLVLAVTAAFGLLPARRVARVAPASFLHAGQRVEGARGGSWSRSLLLSGEVALSLVLLLGAGLLLRTLGEIRSVELGYRVEGVERFRLSTPDSRYDVGATGRLFEELEARLAALPGVEAAGYAFGVPLASGSMSTGVEVPSRPDLEAPVVDVRVASSGYLGVLGAPLVQGRWFNPDDRRGAEAVAVINEAAARVLFPDRSPLGEQVAMSVSWGYDDDPPRTVVGVVGDTRVRDATRPDGPALYVPDAQFGASDAYFTIRRAAGAASVLPAARAIVAELDPELAVTAEGSLAEAVDRETATTRFYLSLLGLFSTLAVVLAAVGLYGVVAFSVSRRVREIGIRRALGARAEDVVGLAVRQGVAPALVGVAIGLVGAWLGARALGSLLYGVRPGDPLTLLGVTALLLLVVLAATILPARRAAAGEPSSALRAE